MSEKNFMENIYITGITPLEYYPCSKNIIETKQNMQNIDICIPCQKPDIESIEELKVSVCTEKYKVIDTMLGSKLILNGVVKIKIIYTANNCEQSLHSAHWDIPFCDFVLLENMCTCDNQDELDLFVGLEDVCVNYNNSRDISLSVLYIVCVLFHKIQNNCNDKKQHCKDNSIKNKPSSGYKNINIKKGNINTYYYPVEHY